MQHIIDELSKKGHEMLNEKYKAFLCAVEQGSLSAAAEELGYTPSGISRMIAGLEEEIGFPLLTRGRMGVKLTQEGELLLGTIKQIHKLEDHMKEIIADVKGLQIGSVVVGTAYNTYYDWISKIIAEFVKVYPDINIKIIEDTSSHLGKMLEEGFVDFCIMSKREGDFRWHTLKEDNLVVWVPKDHPSALKGNFPRAQLAKEPFIELFPGLETDNSLFLKENKIQVNTKYSTGDAFALSHMVEAGLGITLTNELYSVMIPGAITALPLEPNVKVDVGIATPRDEKCSPAVKKFIEFAEKYYETIEAK